MQAILHLAVFLVSFTIGGLQNGTMEPEWTQTNPAQVVEECQGVQMHTSLRPREQAGEVEKAGRRGCVHENTAAR